MRSFRNRPIRQKIVGVVALASLAALLITGTTALVYEATSFRPKAARDLNTQAEVVRANVTAAMSFFDEAAAREILETLGARPEIQASAVYTDRGIFAGNVRAGNAGYEFPVSPEPAGSHFYARQLHLWQEIRTEDGLIGYLFIDRDLPPFLARLPQYGLMVAPVLMALGSAALVLLLMMRRMISEPILDLSRAAGRVRDISDYTVRVKKRTDDDIGRLTEAFNEMLDTIEQRETALRQAAEEQRLLEERLTQAQKMESIGRLAGGVAHDFNNFLTVIGGCVELMREEDSSPADVTLVNNIERAANQAADLTRQLLAFARKQVIEPRVIDPVALVQETRQMLRRLIQESIELVVEPEAEPWLVRVDPNQLTQVLMNLATNARDAMPNGGRLTIRTENTVIGESVVRDQPWMSAGEYVSLSVSDSGEGMTEETRLQLFEPFFTTKDRGKGTGLGLATCYGIVKQSGGHIWVESEPKLGTTFKVLLPRCADSETQEQLSPPVSPQAECRETVLVVEDSPLVRQTTVNLLQAMGYRVLEADGGVSAARIAENFSETIDLLVTDVVMPRMSGPQVARQLQRLRPELKVLYVSGYAKVDVEADTSALDEVTLLQKPFNSETLARRVRDVLES